MKSLFIVICLLAPVLGMASALDCFVDSHKRLGQSRAIQLCAGGLDSMPAECFGLAKKARLNDIEALQLCEAATVADAPVSCYNRARALHLTQGQALELCRFSGNGYAVQCYEGARSALTENSAIELCVQSPSAETLHCFSRAREAHFNRNEAIQLCQSRRFNK